MGIEDLLKLTQKQFQKKFKDSETEFQMAADAKPPTGIIVDNPMLEYVLDRRFLAFGRCVLVYGKKGCSKTSLFFDFAKLFQRNGGDVVWLETEHAADLDYARKQGVNLDKMVLQQPATLQETLSLAKAYITNMPEAYPDGNTPLLICIDSIAGCTHDWEVEESQGFGLTKVGEHARICSHFYRDIIGPLSHEKCVLLVLNQLKDKIGVPSWGPEAPEALIGGEAQRFHSTYQFKMQYIKPIMQTDDTGAERKFGSKHRILCTRNKLGREGANQEAHFDLYITGGIDWWTSLVRMVADNYSHLIGGASTGWYTWKTPDTKYIDKDGTEKVIDITKKYRDQELAQIIYGSVPAKELIRQNFKIPDLPPTEVVKAIEEENKMKRGKKKEPQEL